MNPCALELDGRSFAKSPTVRKVYETEGVGKAGEFEVDLE